jgi:hypothetical protein
MSDIQKREVNSMLKLFSYKLTHDTGFAPNPFWGTLTLATCKPRIRLSKRKGDWIAGFTSQFLSGDPVGKEKLVYLMQVTSKLSFGDYFNSPYYSKKIPDMSQSQCVFVAGDNIYRPVGNRLTEKFMQLRNPYHGEDQMERDLSGKFVLASNRFYYFGREAIEVPLGMRPDIPKGQSANGSLTHDLAAAQKFIEYVTSKYHVGVHGTPHSWPVADNSWSMR